MPGTINIDPDLLERVDRLSPLEQELLVEHIRLHREQIAGERHDSALKAIEELANKIGPPSFDVVEFIRWDRDHGH
jgi:hypothetical protein